MHWAIKENSPEKVKELLNKERVIHVLYFKYMLGHNLRTVLHVDFALCVLLTPKLEVHNSRFHPGSMFYHFLLFEASYIIEDELTKLGRAMHKCNTVSLRVIRHHNNSGHKRLPTGIHIFLTNSE